jgi:hypothetical protein
MIKLFVGLVFLAAAIWQLRRFNKVLKDPVRDDVCVACNSAQLTSLGTNAYRCNACGYEGGSGLMAMRDAAKTKKLEAMSPEQRRASGLKDLREARTLLLGCQGIMQHTVSLSRADLMGGGDAGHDKQRELATAMREMMLAEKMIGDARRKLSDELDEASRKTFEVSFFGAGFFLDTAGDNIFVDLAMHSKIKEAAQHCDRMLEGVEGALERLDVT